LVLRLGPPPTVTKKVVSVFVRFHCAASSRLLVVMLRKGQTAQSR
jgi:hypothetical protein